MNLSQMDHLSWLPSDRTVSFRSWLLALTRLFRFMDTTSEFSTSLRHFSILFDVLIIYLTSFFLVLFLFLPDSWWCHNGRTIKTTTQDSCQPEHQLTPWHFGQTMELLTELQWTSCGFKADPQPCYQLNSSSRPSSTRRSNLCFLFMSQDSLLLLVWLHMASLSPLYRSSPSILDIQVLLKSQAHQSHTSSKSLIHKNFLNAPCFLKVELFLSFFGPPLCFLNP